MPEQPSKPSPESPEKPDRNAWAQASLALSIPGLLMAGPIVGYVLALGLQRWLHWGNWIVGVMVLLGFVAGARESIDVIRKISK